MVGEEYSVAPLSLEVSSVCMHVRGVWGLKFKPHACIPVKSANSANSANKGLFATRKKRGVGNFISSKRVQICTKRTRVIFAGSALIYLVP
jgi:hypothetical protein